MGLNTIKLQSQIRSDCEFEDIQKKRQNNTLSVDVLTRILTVLSENGKINRTNLAGRSGLNYNSCVKYIKLMQWLGWIIVISDEGCFVTITEKGIEIRDRLEKYMIESIV